MTPEEIARITEQTRNQIKELAEFLLEAMDIITKQQKELNVSLNTQEATK